MTGGMRQYPPPCLGERDVVHGTPQLTPLLQPEGKLCMAGRVPDHAMKFDDKKSKRITIQCFAAPGDREEVRPRTSWRASCCVSAGRTSTGKRGMPWGIPPPLILLAMELNACGQHVLGNR